MILSFSGLQHQVEIEPGRLSFLEIENQTLFSRLAGSLLSESGTDSLEPYSVWESEREIRPKDAFLCIANPLCLPWDHRLVAGKMLERIEKTYIEDDVVRIKIEELGRNFFNLVERACFQLDADYAFGLEWDAKRLLKQFGFSPDLSACESLLDSLIMFTDFVFDMVPNQPLLFVNLQKFLTEKELNYLIERFFFHKTTVLSIESGLSECRLNNVWKMQVDQHFCETIQSGYPSSTQGGFCANGFGAVTS